MTSISRSTSAPVWEELFACEDRDEEEVRLFASLFDLFSRLAGQEGFAPTSPHFPER